MEDLVLREKVSSTPSGDTWKGLWQNNKIAAKFINNGNQIGLKSIEFDDILS